MRKFHTLRILIFMIERGVLHSYLSQMKLKSSLSKENKFILFFNFRIEVLRQMTKELTAKKTE